MSITDELREWINGNTIIHVTELRAIADRIDAEHEEKVSYWQGACYEDGYKEGLADNEDAMAENAKLRELASLMWCELHAEQGSAQRRMEIADRLRELGVVE